MHEQQHYQLHQNESAVLSKDWPRRLRKLLEGRDIVLVGVGNPMRSDDYVGSLVAKDLAKITKNQERITIVDAENSPENVLHNIAKKEGTLTVFVDSVDVGLQPGSIILADLGETSYPFFTTHNLPLKMLTQFLPESSRLALLGVQPRNIEVAGKMSREVRSAQESIVQEMVKLFDGLR